MTQNQAILAHLKRGQRITGLQALQWFGCIHLPRRILDLKEAGHRISSRTIKLPDGKRVSEYWLDERIGN